MYALFLAFVFVVAVLAMAAAAAELLEKHVLRRRHRLHQAGRRERVQAIAVELVTPAFVCPDCGAKSWHPEDGRQGWCGRCHRFTGRPAGLDIPAERRSA